MYFSLPLCGVRSPFPFGRLWTNIFLSLYSHQLLLTCWLEKKSKARQFFDNNDEAN